MGRCKTRRRQNRNRYTRRPVSRHSPFRDLPRLRAVWRAFSFEAPSYCQPTESLFVCICSACSTSQESDWFLVNPDESSTWTDFDCFPSRRTHCATTDCGRVSRSAPCSPRPNRKSRPLSSLTSTGSSCDTITRTWSLSETDRMEGFAIRQPRSPLLSRSSASTLGRPSPTRDDRIAAFPDRPSRSSRSCSAPRLQNRKMRNSLGSSDLTRARVSFRDTIDADDRDEKEHFTVHTIMVNHRETDDLVRWVDTKYRVCGV